MVGATLEQLGRIDVLVNNAARIRNGPLEVHSIEEFDLHYAVNVRAPFFLAQAALPALRRGLDPAIVNISSSVGSMVKPGTMLYGSSKAALEYLTRAWAYELAADGIRVNCIAPGPVDTPIHATYTDDSRPPTPISPAGSRWRAWVTSGTSRRGSGSLSPRRPRGRRATCIHADGGQVLGLPESAGG